MQKEETGGREGGREEEEESRRKENEGRSDGDFQTPGLKSIRERTRRDEARKRPFIKVSKKFR